MASITDNGDIYISYVGGADNLFVALDKDGNIKAGWPRSAVRNNVASRLTLNNKEELLIAYLGELRNLSTSTLEVISFSQFEKQMSSRLALDLNSQVYAGVQQTQNASSGLLSFIPPASGNSTTSLWFYATPKDIDLAPIIDNNQNVVKNKTAFTLLELVVYSVLFSVLTLLIAGFCSFIFISLRQYNHRVTMTTKNMLALDALRRDVMSACFEPAQWDAQRCVFVKEYLDRRGHAQKQCVGWDCVRLSNDTPALRRSVGEYDFKNHQWLRRVSHTVGCWLHDLSMHLEVDKKTAAVQRVHITYRDQSANALATDVVALRNRVLP